MQKSWETCNQAFGASALQTPTASGGSTHKYEGHSGHEGGTGHTRWSHSCDPLMRRCHMVQLEREEARKAEKARKKEEARLAAEAEAKAAAEAEAKAEAEAAAKAQAEADDKRKVR